MNAFQFWNWLPFQKVKRMELGNKVIIQQNDSKSNRNWFRGKIGTRKQMDGSDTHTHTKKTWQKFEKFEKIRENAFQFWNWYPFPKKNLRMKLGNRVNIGTGRRDKFNLMNLLGFDRSSLAEHRKEHNPR